ncbi:hypothetical protein ACF0H5_002033 [Mactra antiquata]
MIITISMELDIIISISVMLQLAIGLPSNLVSLIIWTKGKKSKSLSCSMYFRLVTLSDALSLLIIFYLTWLWRGDPVSFQLMFFFKYFLPSLSTWLMVCISFERYLSLICPFSFRPAGARIRALIAFVCLVMILTGINSYVFFMNDYDLLKYTLILHEIATLWTLCIIPFVLINLTNILILIKLYQMKQQRLGRNRQSNHATSFTKMAIISCVLQSISIAPLMILMLLRYYYSDVAVYQETEFILSAIVYCTIYLNNCFNFFIYYCNSSNFRSDFKEMCCCCCRRNTIHQLNATTIASTRI